MPIDPNQVSQPTSSEMIPGGSYLPQDQQDQGFSPSFDAALSEKIASDAKGKLSDTDNDFGLTISGIADGDPVGMETFDLGFFQDGTPAIKINGANVPIRHDQWMSLLTQRNKSRAEMKARIEFETLKQKGKTAITKILASAPNIPQQLGELLLLTNEMNPELAVKETNDLLASMSRDNGVGQIGRLSDTIQQSGVDAEKSRLSAEVEIPIRDEFGLTDKTQKSTVARQRSIELLKDSSDPSNRTTAFAIDNIATMFPPKGLKQQTRGGSVGVFDMIAMEGADTDPLSRYDMLRHLAAHSNLWPISVPMQDAPPNYGGFIGQKSAVGIDWSMAPDAWIRFRNYLMKLDDWASKTLKWDRSSPANIDGIISQMMSSKNYQQEQERYMNQQQNQTRPAQNQSGTVGIDLES